MSPFFRKKLIVMQETLGERFKKVRLGKNWTIDIASKKANISRVYLDALEQSRYEDIAGEVYIKNFIVKYSKILGLNHIESLKQYSAEKHIIEKKYHHSLQEIAAEGIINTLLFPKIVRRGFICAVVIIVLGYIGLNIYQTIAPPFLEIYSPQNNSTVADLVITVSGKASQEAEVAINQEGVLLKEDGTFFAQVALQNGLNLIVITAKRAYGLEKKVLRHILANYERSVVRK